MHGNHRLTTQGSQDYAIMKWRLVLISTCKYYYSFKIFPCFWLVKTTCIVYHNQLLLTKFGKNFVILNQWHQSFCHIEPMMSKWCQKCNLLQVIELVTEKTWGQGSAIFGEQKNIEWKWFKWMIKKLLNSAFVGYKEFLDLGGCYPARP